MAVQVRDHELVGGEGTVGELVDRALTEELRSPVPVQWVTGVLDGDGERFGVSQHRHTVGKDESCLVLPGVAFTYERRVRPGPNGSFDVRLAYPGRYTAAWGNGSATVVVSDRSVRTGGVIRTHLGRADAG